MPHDDRDGSLSDWLARFGISWPDRRDPLWSRSVAHRSGGLFATRALRRFVEILRGIEHPALLDVGPASGQTVSYLGHELGCRLVVADLYAALDEATRIASHAGRRDAIERCLNQPAASADGMLCWDVCDYLDQQEVETFASAVARVLAPGGVAFVMFSTVTYGAPEVTRFAIEDIDHLRYKPAPSSMSQRQTWLSRDVARLFGALRVDETYLLSHGLREVIVRKPRASR